MRKREETINKQTKRVFIYVLTFLGFLHSGEVKATAAIWNGLQRTLGICTKGTTRSSIHVLNERHSEEQHTFRIIAVPKGEINLARNYSLFSSLWLYSPLDLGRFFSFLILYAAGRTPWTGDQPVATPLRTHRITQAQNKRTQTCMPRVGFEHTTPVLKRVKTVHALDVAVTVNGCQLSITR
jgi:hypothetical protein